VEDFFRGRVPDLIQWLLRFGYGLYGVQQTDAELLDDMGAKLNRGQTYLVNLSGQVIAGSNKQGLCYMCVPYMPYLYTLYMYTLYTLCTGISTQFLHTVWHIMRSWINHLENHE
jgi:hypothetical protein